MDVALVQGDIARDERGLPYLLQGDQELLQRAYIRLQGHRGQFVYDRELGSDLYLISAENGADQQAIILARQALGGLAQVTGAQVVQGAQNTEITVQLQIEGRPYQLQIVGAAPQEEG
ncbi:MAG TPA: histidine kinase [Candidatus Gallacutalibacter stercoravium]|nr:histidine kinase [Candidatus Gallacutalibacter stercoravium]